MRRKILVAWVVLSLIILGACGGDSPQEARGLIVDVQAGSIIEWETLTLRLPDGKERLFLRGAEVDLRFWRASHLREHMASAQPVTVTYEKSDKGLIATRISD